MLNSLVNGKIQGLFKAFECFSSTFRANLIFKDFSRQSCIFKCFSSLCEPCTLYFLCLLSSADFTTLTFSKILSETLSECQRFCIQIKAIKGSEVILPKCSDSSELRLFGCEWRPRYFLCFCCRLLTFYINFFEKFFQKPYQSVKRLYSDQG